MVAESRAIGPTIASLFFFQLRNYVATLFHKVLSLFNPYTHITIQLQSMASIRALLFLALSFTMGNLTISDLLINLANHNHNNSLIFIAVPTFLFFLVPFTFISAIILLLFYIAIPQSTVFIKHFTMATRVLVSATLLVGVPLMVNVTFTEAVVPDSLKIILICATVAATAVATVYNPFKRYFNSASRTVGSFVPGFAALCISTGTFLYLSYQNHENSLFLVPIQLLLLSLSCIDFILAVVLLFLYISVPTDGLDHKQTTIHAVLIKAVLAMSFTTIGLVGFYMVFAPLVRFI